MTDAQQAQEAAAADTAQPQDQGGVSPAADPVEALTRENTELKDRVLRTLAEMENLRRRTEREIADGRAYAVTAFARDALSVADNIRRALQSISPEWKATADAGGQALVDGFDLTERDLLKVLEKHGIKKLEPQGQKFDPNLHQAMFEVPDASVPTGTVVQVLQDGFTIGDRILRPALVGVAKGGPKAAAAETVQDSGDN
ncbi:MAG: nucleotide exchange factor GrpE [Xanthobacteraceae bacterium]